MYPQAPQLASLSRLVHTLLQQVSLLGQSALLAHGCPAALARLLSPTAASTTPARPKPNLRSASRRETPSARDLERSSNCLSIRNLLSSERDGSGRSGHRRHLLRVPLYRLAGEQVEYRLRSYGNICGQDPLLVNQVADRRGEHGVELGDLPLLL